MADDQQQQTPGANLTDFPPPNFPTVFADGVSSIANSPSLVKYYLFRFEPSFVGDGRSQTQPFAQVVMPMEGFASMFAFFERAVSQFVAQGLISEAKLEEHRKFHAQTPWRP